MDSDRTVFTAKTSALSYTELRHGLNTSIKEFYNTTEPIWTYDSMVDSRTNISCLVDVTTNTTRSYLYFERFWYSNEKRLKFQLRRLLDKGHMDKTLVYDAAKPIYEQPNPLFQEELLYQSEDMSCGVFKYFQHPNVVRFDLRVWNCSIVMGPERNCSKYFEEVYAHHSHRPPFVVLEKRRVYNHTCQAILKPPDGC
uniref:Lipocalin/cytosolic fatty-acid binding domain-containing protein n=1 Tax=Amblyomma maculatum TaxID=34609 RepID=G3MPC9_AMBMU